eukprot:6425681-Prymnesium_polylepis.2
MSFSAKAPQHVHPCVDRGSTWAQGSTKDSGEASGSGAAGQMRIGRRIVVSVWGFVGAQPDLRLGRLPLAVEEVEVQILRWDRCGVPKRQPDSVRKRSIWLVRTDGVSSPEDDYAGGGGIIRKRPGIIPVRVKDHPSESLVRVRIPLACGGGVIISALWRCLTEEDLAGALVVQLAPHRAERPLGVAAPAKLGAGRGQIRMYSASTWRGCGTCQPHTFCAMDAQRGSCKGHTKGRTVHVWVGLVQVLYEGRGVGHR